MDFSVEKVGGMFSKPPFLIGLGIVGILAVYTIAKRSGQNTQAAPIEDTKGTTNVGQQSAYSSEDVSSMFQYFDSLISSEQETNAKQTVLLEDIKKSLTSTATNNTTQDNVTTTTPVVTTAPAAPATPANEYVTVAKWTSSNTPWNSTLWGISQRYGTTVDTLMSLNPNITNRDLIYPNQQIRVK